MPALKVAINAQTEFWVSGGGSTVLLGMIRALGELSDGDEEYVIIATRQNAEMLREYSGPNQRVVINPTPFGRMSIRGKMPVRQRVRRVMQNLSRYVAPRMWPEVPLSDGFYEHLGCDLIHFPYPYPVICSMPMIFQVYDLQHRHFPSYFSPREIVSREVNYSTGCDLAQIVITASQWAKQDIVEKYRTPADKIHVVRNAPPTQAQKVSTPPDALKRQYNLPTAFILYPASTHAHKNHIRLLDAIALLRDRDNLHINLVCTGNNRLPYSSSIRQHITERKLTGQVRFLGLIPPEDLRGLYQMASFVVFPSTFEGAGYPPLEAFAEGTAVACSTATALPEMVGAAAFLFDPFSVEAIAAAIKQMATDATLREDFQRRGRKRLRDFSWERAARTYRALYRKTAGWNVTDEDRRLLVET